MPRVFYEVWKVSDDYQVNLQELKFIEVNVKKKLMEIPTFYFTIHRNPDSELVAPAIGDKVKIFRNYQEQLRGTILKMELRKNTIYYEGVSSADDWNYADGTYLSWKNASLNTILGKFASEVGWTRGTVESRTVSRFDYDYGPYYKQLDRLAEMLGMEYLYDEKNKKIHFMEHVGTDQSINIRFKRGVNLDDLVVKIEQDETWDKVICLGAGDGKNQLRAVRGTGQKVKVFTDKSIKSQADLNRYADNKLKEGDKPRYVYYEAQIEGPLYHFDLGDTVWIEDDLNRVNEPMRIMEYSLTFNKTEQISIVFANKKQTLTDFFKKMEEGQRTLQNVNHSSAVQQGMMIKVDDEQDPIELNVNNDNFINLDTGNSIGQVETKLNTTQEIASSAQTDATNAQITADEALESANKAPASGFHYIVSSPAPLINGDYSNLEGGLKVRVTQPVHVGKVSIYAETDGISGIVQLRKIDGTILKAKGLVLSEGENRVNLDFMLYPDVGEYIIWGKFEGGTFRTSPLGVTFPYNSGSFEVFGTTSATGHWPHFYKISVSGAGVEGDLQGTVDGTPLEVIKLKTDGTIVDINGTYFVDGGSILAHSITSDHISAQGIVADKIRSGTLLLGGENNVNGRFLLNNASGDTIADFDGANNLVSFDTIRAGNIVSDSIVTANNLNFEIYVDPQNGSDEADGTLESPYQSISRALMDVPKFNDGEIVIHLLSSGTEHIRITGLGGGGIIRFQFNNHTINGSIVIYSCTNTIRMYDGEINYLGDDFYAIADLRQNSYVFFRNMRFFGPPNMQFGVVSNEKSYTQIRDCTVESGGQAIRAAFASSVVVYDCNGRGGTDGINASYGGEISGLGTAPKGSVNDARTYYGGVIRSNFTHIDSPTSAPPAPEETVRTWNSIDGDSWRSYGNWLNYGDVRQGDWTGNGLHRGFWFFGDGPSKELVGKTINKMRLYVTRRSAGGYSASRTATFRYHNYTSKTNAGSGTPAVSSTTASANFAWGEGKWVTLPTSFHAPFEAGTAKGIAIYTTSTRDNYMIFSKNAKLEVIYS